MHNLRTYVPIAAVLRHSVLPKGLRVVKLAAAIVTPQRLGAIGRPTFAVPAMTRVDVEPVPRLDSVSAG